MTETEKRLKRQRNRRERGAERSLGRIDADKLKAMTDNMTPQSESAGDFIRRTRDEDRY